MSKKEEPLKEPAVLVGGVVPHHDLVKKEIDKFWRTASERIQPEVIVLIGPDHEDASSASITVPASRDVFKNQVSVYRDIPLDFKRDDRVFRSDHSIRTHLPFIASYFPNSDLLPIAVRSDATKRRVLEMSEVLHAQLPGAVLVVSSVDFSHYENAQDAGRYDQESIAALENFDYDRLIKFGPEHVDSDQSLIMMSQLVCPSHDCLWETLYHGNSADYQLQNPKVTTSYYSLMLNP